MGQGESALDRCARDKSCSGRECVLGTFTGNIDSEYDLGEQLGNGQFGVIRRCTKKRCGEQFACKSIKKSGLLSAEDVDDVRREIEVMKKVAGHPNIVELKAVYEDEESVHLVMELCDGGELFDYITENKKVSEREAARVCKTLMDVLKHFRSRGVIHRDLKPENILLSRKKSLFPIKVADFGLAVNAYPGEKFSGMAGSAYYIAPEILKRDYGAEVDIWSVGVIVYILLSGTPPFWDETDDGIFNAIRNGLLDLSSNPWPSLSAEVKDLLKGMLCLDVKQRLTPEQVSNHAWILRHTEGEDGESAFAESFRRSSSYKSPFSSFYPAAEEVGSSASSSVTSSTDWSTESLCLVERNEKCSSRGITPITDSSDDRSEVSVSIEQQTTSAAASPADSFEVGQCEVEMNDRDCEIARCTNADDSTKAAMENRPNLLWSSFTSEQADSGNADLSSDNFLAAVVYSLEDMPMSPFRPSTPVKFQKRCNFETIKSSWEEKNIMADATYRVGEISVRP